MENYMARLNEYAQKNGLVLRFEDVACDGPDHIKTFSIRVVLNAAAYPEGVGKNKKQARQKAAENALRALKELPNSETPGNATQAPSPSQSIVPQPKYMSWLNEYGQKHGVDIKPMESITVQSNTPMKSCRFVIGDREYPEATGNTKKEAKEEAAKLAFNEIHGVEENSELGRSTPVSQPQQLLNVSSISGITNGLTAMAIDNGFAEANYIGNINHYCQRNRLQFDFVLVDKHGPSHEPQFFYKLVINKQEYDVGEGKSITEAKQKAAQLAWSVLQANSCSDVRGDVPAGVSTPKSSTKDCEMGATGLPLLNSKRVSFNESPAPPKPQTPQVKSRKRLAANFSGMTPESKETTFKQYSDNQRFTRNYESIHPIGCGTFGSVYTATDKILQKKRAVKIVCCKNIEKALREVKVLSDLSHCNIVRFYKCWFEDSSYPYWPVGAHKMPGQDSSQKYLYIEMELCSSGTLQSWIENNQKSQDRKEESLWIFRQVVNGVEYIHANDFIHRDLKPANIMFSDNKEKEKIVKIGDFGLVTAVANNAQNPMERTVYKGTPYYMAPEQKEKSEYDQKVDIFALGLIYFELLWSLSIDEKHEIWEDVRNKKTPESFSQKYQFEDLMIKKMLSMNPESRPTAKEVQSEIKKDNPCKIKTV